MERRLDHLQRLAMAVIAEAGLAEHQSRRGLPWIFVEHITQQSFGGNLVAENQLCLRQPHPDPRIASNQRRQQLHDDPPPAGGSSQLSADRHRLLVLRALPRILKHAAYGITHQLGTPPFPAILGPESSGVFPPVAIELDHGGFHLPLRRVQHRLRLGHLPQQFAGQEQIRLVGAIVGHDVPRVRQRVADLDLDPMPDRLERRDIDVERGVDPEADDEVARGVAELLRTQPRDGVHRRHGVDRQRSRSAVRCPECLQQRAGGLHVAPRVGDDLATDQVRQALPHVERQRVPRRIPTAHDLLREAEQRLGPHMHAGALRATIGQVLQEVLELPCCFRQRRAQRVKLLDQSTVPLRTTRRRVGGSHRSSHYRAATSAPRVRPIVPVAEVGTKGVAVPRESVPTPRTKARSTSRTQRRGTWRAQLPRRVRTPPQAAGGSVARAPAAVAANQEADRVLRAATPDPASQTRFRPRAGRLLRAR